MKERMDKQNRDLYGRFDDTKSAAYCERIQVKSQKTTSAASSGRMRHSRWGAMKCLLCLSYMDWCCRPCGADGWLQWK
jgi:hypothetical protein